LPLAPGSGDGGSNTMADVMPVDTIEKTGSSRGESNPVGASPAREKVSGDHEARQSVSPPPDQRPSRRRRLLLIGALGALGALVLAVVCIFGIPWILAFSTPFRRMTPTLTAM
jgi:hypothetical protein